MQTRKKLLEPLKEIKWYAAISFSGLFVWGVNNIIGILVLEWTVSSIESNNIDRFTYWIIGFICWIIVYQIFNYRFVFRYGYIQEKLREVVDKKYLTKFFYLDNNAVEKLGTGQAINIIMTGNAAWYQMIDYFLMQIPSIITSFIFGAYMILRISRVYFIIFVIVSFIVNRWVKHIMYQALKRRRKRKEFLIEHSRQMVKMIMSKFEILQNNKVWHEVKQITTIIHKILEINKKKHFYEHIGYNMGEVFMSILKIIIIVIIGLGIFQWSKSYTTLIVIISVLGYIENNINSVKQMIRHYNIHINDIQKVRDLFDNTPQIPWLYNGKEFIYKNGDITLDKISFTYTDEQVFKNLSLTIQGGKKTALVWISGSGKSTIIKLIAWYIHPDKGDIIIDNQKLSNTKLISYYQHIGYLTQDPSVFDGSIRENITYGIRTKVTNKEINQALKNAKCEFVFSFKSGLDTQIGERGVRLSGGQKQRLAIAKIFLKNPQIILLDEPTSALDSVSEKSITQALHKLYEDRTVIIIAHRLQTVKQADDIIVFEKGKIVQRWTHSKLAKQSWTYKQMLELQSGF